MTPKYELSQLNRFVRNHLRSVFRVVYRVFARVNISGTEHVPAKGPYIIVFNHVSIYDSPFLITCWKSPPEPVGALDAWNNPIEGIFFKLYGGIVLDRRQYHRSALEQAVEALKAGQVLLYAPEGRLSKKPGMQQARAGIAFILEKINVPVVPVGIVGSTVDFLKMVIRLQRPVLEMRIGKSIQVPPIVKSPAERLKMAYQRNADWIMNHVAALLPPEYRGYYQQPNHFFSEISITETAG